MPEHFNAAMKHQVLICSYPPDYGFLTHLLVSLKRFSVGFLHPVIAVESRDFMSCRALVDTVYPEATVLPKSGRPGQGFISAQLRMMKADVLCPDADVIYFIGSDCIVHSEFRPDPYCTPTGKPIVLFTSYAVMGVHAASASHWQTGTHRILGFKPENEYMRRLPTVLPREVFAPMRHHVERQFGREFEDYIYCEDDGKTSEANILGAFAHRFMPWACSFVDTATVTFDSGAIVELQNAVGQMWSKGGLNRPSDACFDYVTKGVKKNAFGRSPQEIINDVLYTT